MLNMWIPKGFSTNTMSPLRFRAVLNMWIPKDQNILDRKSNVFMRYRVIKRINLGFSKNIIDCKYNY